MHKTYEDAGVKPGDGLRHQKNDYGLWIVATEENWDATYNPYDPFANETIKTLLNKEDVPVVRFDSQSQPGCRGAIRVRALKKDWYICSEVVVEESEDKCPACGGEISWICCALKCEDCGKIICG